MIARWLTENKLGLAETKTEAVMIIGRKKCGKVELKLGSTLITPSRLIKYLGVQIDKKLCYKEHVQPVCNRAQQTASALARLMPRVDGPSSSKRKLLATVVECKLLYAAPIWARAMEVGAYRRKMEAVQRKAAIGASRCYRTVSQEALLVIAGIIPIDLMALERSKTHGKSNEKK